MSPTDCSRRYGRTIHLVAEGVVSVADADAAIAFAQPALGADGRTDVFISEVAKGHDHFMRISVTNFKARWTISHKRDSQSPAQIDHRCVAGRPARAASAICNAGVTEADRNTEGVRNA